MVFHFSEVLCLFLRIRSLTRNRYSFVVAVRSRFGLKTDSPKKLYLVLQEYVNYADQAVKWSLKKKIYILKIALRQAPHVKRGMLLFLSSKPI